MNITPLSPTAQDKTNELVKLYENNNHSVHLEVSLSNPKLNIQARNGNRQRIVKHIHQHCQSLYEEFFNGTEIK
jgi:hypothetical protein